MNYYQESPEKVLEELRTTESGLSHQEAGDRLAKYGPNKLAEGKKVTLLQRFIQQLCDPMISFCWWLPPCRASPQLTPARASRMYLLS